MTTPGSTLPVAPEPPTVPRIEWPVVLPAVARSSAPLALSTTGRHGAGLGDAAIPAAALVDSGTYVGKAQHARLRAL